MLLELTRYDGGASAAMMRQLDAPLANLEEEPATYVCVSPLSGVPIDDLVAIRGPVVETRRLRLRPFQMDDFAAYADMVGDPANWDYSERGPFTSDEAWTRFLRHSGHWQMLGFGTFGVFDKHTDEFIGEVGFSQFNRNLGGHFDWAPEASWMIASRRKGEGLATEAVAGAVTWMERVLGVTRSVCIVHERNMASLRVAEKIGFRPFKRSEFKGYPAVFFERVVIGL